MALSVTLFYSVLKNNKTIQFKLLHLVPQVLVGLMLNVANKMEQGPVSAILIILETPIRDVDPNVF
jgi:hypothetical protein